MNENSSISYIEFLENAGFPLDTDVGRKVEASSRKQLEEFRDLYLQLVKSFRAEMGLEDTVFSPEIAGQIKKRFDQPQPMGCVFR